MIPTEPLRAAVLAILLASMAGLGLELVLLEHTESWLQWLPLVLLAAGFAHALAVAVRPSRSMLLALRVTMLVFCATGLLGLYLHYHGNAAFELEMQPELSGARLVRRALQGATPALAPAAMTQLGLLGLAYTFRHPALARTRTASTIERRHSAT